MQIVLINAFCCSLTKSILLLLQNKIQIYVCRKKRLQEDYHQITDWNEATLECFY